MVRLVINVCTFSHFFCLHRFWFDRSQMRQRKVRTHKRGERACKKTCIHNPRSDLQPIHINGDCVERVSDFKFLGLHLGDDLTWKTNTTALIKKAQQ